MAKVDIPGLSARIKRGIPVRKTNTCDGNGAQNDNLYTLTGTILVLSVKAECIEATDSTTLSGNSLELYDGAASVEITDSDAPVDASGIGVGGMLSKVDVDPNVALAFQNNAAGGLTQFANDTPFLLHAKTGVTTYIRHLFTGDANTDVDLRWVVHYLPWSDDGALTAA